MEGRWVREVVRDSKETMYKECPTSLSSQSESQRNRTTTTQETVENGKLIKFSLVTCELRKFGDSTPGGNLPYDAELQYPTGGRRAPPGSWVRE